MNIKLLSVKEISDQDIVYGIFYCKYKELKKTKYGDSYISIGLRDNSGVLDSKVWKNSEFYHSKFNEGDIVAVKGFPNLYRKKIELNIAHIAKCNPLRYEKYGFDPSMIVSKIKLDNQMLWKEICGYFKKTGNRVALIEKMYSDYKKAIILFPSNIEVGFQIEGFYLSDVSKGLKMADILLNSVSDKELIDSDLVYSLIFLMKFDLITGYKKDIVYKISDESSDRGLLAVFYEVFKKYRKFIDKKLFFSLEKCIFDAGGEDFILEKKITKEIFSLIGCVY